MSKSPQSILAKAPENKPDRAHPGAASLARAASAGSFRRTGAPSGRSRVWIGHASTPTTASGKTADHAGTGVGCPVAARFRRLLGPVVASAEPSGRRSGTSAGPGPSGIRGAAPSACAACRPTARSPAPSAARSVLGRRVESAHRHRPASRPRSPRLKAAVARHRGGPSAMPRTSAWHAGLQSGMVFPGDSLLSSG